MTVVVGRFDDGSSEVPGGVEWPVRRVLVVGAGIAGLTVASALRHAGVECAVLEARRRVGGRLHTLDVAGSPVDPSLGWVRGTVSFVDATTGQAEQAITC